MEFNLQIAGFLMSMPMPYQWL